MFGLSSRFCRWRHVGWIARNALGQTPGKNQGALNTIFAVVIFVVAISQSEPFLRAKSVLTKVVGFTLALRPVLNGYSA